jgi:pimeloyl-ACP methyl ester carboxylesterase
MRKGFPEVDQAILDHPEANIAMMQNMKEAFSSGYNGGLEDALIYKKDWGFELSDIDTKVFLWHGEKDENVKIETASFVADQLPNCQWEVKSEEGHLSLIYKYADEIFLQISGN